MESLEIRDPDFAVWYDAASQRVCFQGLLRLNGSDEYQPMVDLLERVLALGEPELRWDLRELEFLNSSGINVLYKFIIKVRKEGQRAFTVWGSDQVTWQRKSLPNMSKFMPELKIIFE